MGESAGDEFYHMRKQDRTFIKRAYKIHPERYTGPSLDAPPTISTHEYLEPLTKEEASVPIGFELVKTDHVTAREMSEAAKRIAFAFGCSVADMKASSRCNRVVEARSAFSKYARSELGKSFSQIARYLTPPGGKPRDHSTIMHYVNRSPRALNQKSRR